jgi:hypothetical protein
VSLQPAKLVKTAAAKAGIAVNLIVCGFLAGVGAWGVDLVKPHHHSVAPHVPVQRPIQQPEACLKLDTDTAKFGRAFPEIAKAYALARARGAVGTLPRVASRREEAQCGDPSELLVIEGQAKAAQQTPSSHSGTTGP